MDEMKYYCKIFQKFLKKITPPWTLRHERDNNGKWALNKEDVRV
jgi:hypothetical protein